MQAWPWLPVVLGKLPEEQDLGLTPILNISAFGIFMLHVLIIYEMQSADSFVSHSDTFNSSHSVLETYVEFLIPLQVLDI